MGVVIRVSLAILCAVCPLFASEGRGGSWNTFLDHVENHGGPPHHHHARSGLAREPRAGADGACARGARCVPRVQCPAVLRTPHLAVCHLAGGHVGVCCTTGQSHASESDVRQRSAASPPSAEALRAAHQRSRQRLDAWLRAERRAAHNGTVLPRSSPSYGHFMSIRTGEVEKEQTLGRGALGNLFAAQDLHQREAVSADQLRLGLVPTTDGPFCPPPPSCPPTPHRYRSIGGECNNVANTGWGASHTAYERVLPPNYSDETWSFRTSVRGVPLPEARAVSAAVLLAADNPSATHNLMLTQFGQLIAHDLTAAVTFTLENGSAISCCTSDGAGFLPPELQHEACAALPVHPDDQFFSQFQHTCMNFVRTQLAPSHDCSLGYAKQMNGVTHYVDLSPVYGSSEGKLAGLREEGTARLSTFTDFGRELPPLSADRDTCLVQQDGAACFASGDDHVNQMISLVMLHALWIREHNRLAEALAQLNPAWPADVVFLEARRILLAEYQHIVYNEWLPLVVGPHIMQAFSLTARPGGEYSADYEPDVNPSLTSEFAAGGLRFGHSTVDTKITVRAPEEMYEEIAIPEVMFQPSRMRLRPFLDRIIAGVTWQPMQSVDPFVSESLTRYMFHGGQPFGVDLAAINIQRGRDHGLRSYNDYLRLIGSKPFTDFSQFPPKAAERLSSVYASPEDVDLWIGGLLEPPLQDAAVGTTFGHILADQFSRLRRGDRYFYEHGPDVNPGAFTKEQLVEIKKASLARLVCDNSDRIELRAHSPRAFIHPLIQGNNPVSCESPQIPRMDLSKFKEL